MATFRIDLSGATGDIRQFDDGNYQASIKEIKLDVSSKGDPMLVIDWEVYHPRLGSATTRDWLVHTFPNKMKGFWLALNGITDSELEDESFDIDTDDLVGQTLIVVLGTQERTDKKGPNGETIYSKTFVAPWYFPSNRVDLLDE